MLRLALAALALAATSAFAEVKSLGDFSGGLNTRNSGILLEDNESPALQNVVLDKNGGVSRRQGYSEVNATAIGDGDDDVNAVYQLERSNGSKYCIAFSSTTGYVSSDGCQTFSVFVSTLSRTGDVNCDAYGDKQYCVNNQYNFSIDGTNDAPVLTAPSDLDFIKVFRDRCFGAGKDTNPSRLYWSNIGTCDTWSPSTDYVDIYAEDGDVITGIGTDLYNHLFVCKNRSSYLIQFDNLSTDNRKVIVISRNIGCKSHRGVVNFANKKFFVSTGHDGGQPGVYSTDGISVEEDTKKLRGEIDTLASFAANTGRKAVDTKADWDAGTFDPYAMSSSRDAGFMQSSYTASAFTTSADWSRGTLIGLSTTDVSGSLTLSSTTFSDDFQDHSFAAGNTTWTATDNNWLNTGDYMITNANGAQPIYSTQVNISSGHWQFSYSFDQITAPIFDQCAISADSECLDFRFMQKDNDNYYSLRISVGGSNTQTVKLMKNVSGSLSVLVSSNIIMADEDWGTFSIDRASNGSMYLYFDGVFVSSTSDTSLTGPFYLKVLGTQTVQGDRVFYQRLDDLIAYQYNSSGTWRSPILDTYISTPIGGPLSSTANYVNGEGLVTFRVRQSSSPNDDMWTSWVAASDTVRVQMGLRYQQLEGQLFTTPAISTKTPRIDAVSLPAASSGTWLSPELFLSNAMTSWGLFRADRTVTGSSATITYQLYITTYSTVQLSTGPITVVPDGSINHSTGAYVRILSTYRVFSASETAKDDIIALNWNEGAAAKSLTAAVYKNRLHVCGQSAAGSVNDVCYVRDQNGAWVKWTGVNARHLNVVGQSFMAAGSSTTGGGFIYRLYDTDSDNGAGIHAFWESKDHAFDKIQNIKAVDRIFMLGSNDATNITTTVKADAGSRTATYDIGLSTGAPFKIIHKNLDRVINGNTFRIRFENSAASKPWSIFGYGLMYRDLGLMAP